jgi:hypothetical protein
LAACSKLSLGESTASLESSGDVAGADVITVVIRIGTESDIETKRLLVAKRSVEEAQGSRTPFTAVKKTGTLYFPLDCRRQAIARQE